MLSQRAVDLFARIFENPVFLSALSSWFIAQILIRNATEAHVILNVEKNVHTAEVVISAKGVQAQGKADTQDMYASIDGAVEKVEKTLKRHHDKQITEKTQGGTPVEVV